MSYLARVQAKAFAAAQMPLLPALFCRSRFWLLLLGLTCLSACAASEAEPTKGQTGKKPAVPVVVAPVTQKTVPLLVRATGTVEAYSTVSVKSQVEGQLTGVYFKQGQDVHKGDLLFRVDPRSLQAAVMQAEATKAKDLAQVNQAKANVTKAIAQVNQAKAVLTKDQAQSRNAKAQAQRYVALFRQGVISQEQVDQYQTSAEAQQATVIADQNAIADATAAVVAAQADVKNAQAAVAADEAAIANTKVQLSYSTIYSPIDGRTSSLQLNQGNLVKADADTPLIMISQIQPIYVTFSIPQRLLPALKQYNAAKRLEVDAMAPNNEKHPARGELTFIDSGVNAKTGTIQLKGTFANTEEQLSPGEFVNVVLKLSELPNAITVPAQAVQNGQQGQFVYVVKADKTVEVRLVKVGDTVANAAVIQQGLKPGEQVVVDGQFNLVPGAIVQVKPGVGSGQ
jgi:multidrug efflux system membrane fusion protein